MYCVVITLSNTYLNESDNFFMYGIFAILVVSLVILALSIRLLWNGDIVTRYRGAWTTALIVSYITGLFVFVFPAFTFFGVSRKA